MLKVLGVVFLVLIGLVVVFFATLFFKVRQGMVRQARVSAIEAGLDAPSIVLEPMEDPSFAQPEKVAELVAQARKLGSTDCGIYDVPAAQARICAFHLEQPSVYIVIYDHDQLSPWLDVVIRLGEDRSFTASTVPEISRGAPRHPDDEVTYFAPGTEVGAMVRAVAEHVGSETPAAVTPGAFKDYFEAAAEKSARYIQTQAVDQEWLSAIADDAGVELFGDEAERINVGRLSNLVVQTENACIRSLAESGDFSAAEWDDMRDDLVAVWDDMPDDYVSSVFYDHVDLPDELEDAVDALEAGHGTARERVSRFNTGLPADKRLIFVATVSSPVEADIYRDQFPDK